ncbi:MAG: OmpA family protein, partial [Alistipes sp.]|nr:OmpA family protein [Alistipes sp.]
MRRFVLIALLLLMGGVTEVEAQSFLKQLGKTVENAAKRKVQQKAEEKTEKAVEDIMDGNILKGKKDKDKAAEVEAEVEETAPTEEAPKADAVAKNEKQKPQSLEMTYAKSDFVPGDEIIFEDLLVGEKLGEFPSMWDLKEGNAEVVSVGGENAIHMGEETLIMPYMKEKDYLPEEFTIEFDLYVPCYYGGNDKVSMNNRYNIDLVDAAGKVVFQAYWYNGNNEMGVPREITWRWHNGGEESQGEGTVAFNMSDFNHIAISFNKRALKFYVNGIRIANIPR